MEKQLAAHTRLSLANERTLLSWCKLTCIFASGGFLTHALTGLRPERDMEHLVQALGQLSLAGLVCITGLTLYHRRRGLFEKKHMGSYSSTESITMVAIGIFATLAITLLRAVHQEAEYASSSCLQLRDFQLTDALPPYFYITFHGPPDALAGMCRGTGAVQRFSVNTGAYVGPATDQRAALVRSPRGLVLHNGVLVVVDAGEGAEYSSLAVFGDCAGRDVRPYMGKVRPRGRPELADAFAHPYGIALAADGTFRVTAQNGGALLAVDIENLTSPVTLLEQIADRPTDLDQSGALRGLAIDDVGCNHVAEKHANKVWHLCPDAKPEWTKVSNPIGLTAHGGALFVSSFDDKTPGVLKFEKHKGDTAFTQTMFYVHKRLKHPTGMVVHRGMLYVLEQVHKQLLFFDVECGTYNGTLISQLPDLPEAIAIIPEC